MPRDVARRDTLSQFLEKHARKVKAFSSRGSDGPSRRILLTLARFCLFASSRFSQYVEWGESLFSIGLVGVGYEYADLSRDWVFSLIMQLYVHAAHRVTVHTEHCTAFRQGTRSAAAGWRPRHAAQRPLPTTRNRQAAPWSPWLPKAVGCLRVCRNASIGQPACAKLSKLGSVYVRNLPIHLMMSVS